MFSRINIVDELVKEKRKSSSEEVLRDAVSLINSESKKEKNILRRIQNPSSFRIKHPVSVVLSKDIFTSEQIKNIAIRYRLRFLDSKLFKGEIPYEAILKVKELEKKHQVKFSEFKILAPASLFKLEDRNKDPLLFAKIEPILFSLPEGKGVSPLRGDERGASYLLIHKWGNDLNGFRKVLAFPLRTIKNFVLTFLALSLLITLAVPVDYNTHMFVFLLSNLFFISTFAHIGYMRLNQNFSEFEWDSKYIN